MNNLFSKVFALSIGPQACGTEILHDYFRRRADVALPKVREVFYFDRHVHRGADFYKAHFKDSEQIKLFMELSTTAFDHPRAPERVKELLGLDVKLFCLLRDPVERSMEVYKHYLRYGIVKGDIREACNETPQILFASRYADHLEKWLEHFNSIHFMSYEGLQSDLSKNVCGLCEFLDIPFETPRRSFEFPKIFMKLPGRRNLGSALSDSDILWLKEQLEGENERLKVLVPDFKLLS